MVFLLQLKLTPIKKADQSDLIFWIYQSTSLKRPAVYDKTFTAIPNIHNTRAVQKWVVLKITVHDLVHMLYYQNSDCGVKGMNI